MSEPFIGEIRLLPFGYAPDGWAPCHGQILPISAYSTLFSVIGVMYGGDGKATFALPDLSGRVAMGWGDGPGLSPRYPGEEPGEVEVKLEGDQLASHGHPLQASRLPAKQPGPTADAAPATSPTDNLYGSAAGALVQLAAEAVGATGGGEAHSNVMPSLGVSYCIALKGIVPPRPE